MRSHAKLRRREFGLLLGTAALLAKTAVRAAGDEPWDMLREELFQGREIADGAGLIALDAPKRAYDAAVVPVTITALVPQSAERFIRRVHLIVDRNPAPVAAVFHLQPTSGSATVATRLRINEYTTVRAIAETGDGALWMVERFVKAAGGCSAPASKDKAAALARLGKMKLKELGPFSPGEVNTIELLVGHPQNTGFQVDPATLLWIPPDYIETIAVRWNDRPLLEVDGDIALSEDPAVTFSMLPEGPGTLAVAVVDSEGRRFEQSWPLGTGS